MNDSWNHFRVYWHRLQMSEIHTLDFTAIQAFFLQNLDFIVSSKNNGLCISIILKQFEFLLEVPVGDC